MSGYPIPPLLPPDSEDLGIYYFTPLLAPTLIDTREPDVEKTADTINGFVTIEASGLNRVDIASYHVSNIFHCYSPVESQASDLARTVMAYGTAVQGKTVMGWYVMGLEVAIGAVKLPNPDIDLPRYRCALTWRVQGRPLSVNGGGVYVPPSNGGSGTPGVFVFGEVLHGNGIDLVFTLVSDYVPNTTRLYVNGVRQLKDVDYHELSSNTISLAVAPTQFDSVVVDYQLNQ